MWVSEQTSCQVRAHLMLPLASSRHYWTDGHAERQQASELPSVRQSQLLKQLPRVSLDTRLSIFWLPLQVVSTQENLSILFIKSPHFALISLKEQKLSGYKKHLGFDGQWKCGVGGGGGDGTEVMDGGDKRKTASGAGGIRVSDFPLKLFYKLCKRFLQQTLEHTRERTFPVEHSQLKAACILQHHHEPKGALSESPLAASSPHALAAPSRVNGGARWVCAGGPGWMLRASTLTPPLALHMLTPRPTRTQVPAPRLVSDPDTSCVRTWSSQSVWTAMSRTTLEFIFL